MNLKNLLIKLVKFYQFFISPLLGSNCRYYPSCSEYAVIGFENDKIYRAFFNTFIRILTCNQFFKGGIDYPIVKKEIKKNFFIKKPDIKYWLVPITKNKFIVIKV